MTQFWTRTRRFLAVLWLGAAVMEAVVLELARRTNDSWVLLLGLALLVIPIVATSRTSKWFGRVPRKRWARHDLEDARASLPSVAPPLASAPARGAERRPD
ncbi:MAG TPA: hypothetical protein VFE05_19400 [Longimicrobiaceae bacterium]|jgi:hypothetical protein|nr:hypothetical protein [Longimicrobiaceae bacterium]